MQIKFKTNSHGNCQSASVSNAITTVLSEFFKKVWIVQKTVKGLAPVAAILIVLSWVSAASAQTLQFPSNSRLNSITSTKSIRVAYRPDARPFSFLNDNKEVVGFTIDLCRLI